MKADSTALQHIAQWVGADAATHVIQKLQKYIDLLLSTNDQYNLIGPKESHLIWQRHILDSAQLYSYIQPLNPNLIIDLGSGAGFPGLILSIMGIPNIILVESIQKKAKFLQQTIDTLRLPARVYAERIENLRGLMPDIITARAVSALGNILLWSYHICHPNTTFLLLKGEKAQEEIDTALKTWKFQYTLIPSTTSPKGQIIQLQALEKR